MYLRRGTIGITTATAIVIALLPVSSKAEEVSVASYGSSVSSFPWVIALKKNFFKDFDADIGGVYATQGGTSDVRAMMAGNLPYAETNPASMIAANKAGADLRMVSENVLTTANVVWVTLPDSPVKTIKDIKGKKITFTSPNSVTHMMNIILVQRAGLKPDEVTLVSTGTYGAALTALDGRGVDVAILAEPNYSLHKDKYRVLAWSSDVLPAINSTVGISSSETIKKRPELLRGIINARRKAVDFLVNHRDESAEILAVEFKLDKKIVRSLIDILVDRPTEGVAFWGDGRFHAQSMDNLMSQLKAMKLVATDTEWRSLVDQSALPDDLKTDLKK